MLIVYGLDTGSIEDAAQCVILDVPDEECDSDESMESWLEEYATYGLSVQSIVNLVDSIKESKV